MERVDRLVVPERAAGGVLADPEEGPERQGRPRQDGGVPEPRAEAPPGCYADAAAAVPFLYAGVSPGTYCFLS